MSSLAGRISQAKQGCYSATKHAIEAFTDALRQEVYPHDVSVSAIEPGFVDTPLVDKVCVLAHSVCCFLCDVGGSLVWLR